MAVGEPVGQLKADIAEISRAEAEQITAGPAAWYWRPTRPGCPGGISIRTPTTQTRAHKV